MTKKAAHILIALALACIFAVSASAQNPASEYEIKAAFVYNFLKFVEWPDSAFPEKNTPIVIGILGADPFIDSDSKVNYLEQAVQGKTINDRKLLVLRDDNIANLKNCQLIFVSRSEKNRLKEIFTALKGKPVLTVGDCDNFSQQGGMINFIRHSGKVRFEINLSASEKAGLKISSKLLNVAILVQTPKR